MSSAKCVAPRQISNNTSHKRGQKRQKSRLGTISTADGNRGTLRANKTFKKFGDSGTFDARLPIPKVEHLIGPIEHKGQMTETPPPLFGVISLTRSSLAH